MNVGMVAARCDYSPVLRNALIRTHEDACVVLLRGDESIHARMQNNLSCPYFQILWVPTGSESRIHHSHQLQALQRTGSLAKTGIASHLDEC